MSKGGGAIWADSQSVCVRPLRPKRLKGGFAALINITQQLEMNARCQSPFRSREGPPKAEGSMRRNCIRQGMWLRCMYGVRSTSPPDVRKESVSLISDTKDYAFVT
jgi:hypothetical protein